jgi:Eukaryotic protein of unknown function (DUF866)
MIQSPQCNIRYTPHMFTMKLRNCVPHIKHSLSVCYVSSERLLDLHLCVLRICDASQDDWIVKSKKCVFEDVDLSENEWTDFDNDAALSVGILGFESKFQLHKGS